GLAVIGLGAPIWLVTIALASHGVFISCFLIAGQVFVNRQATHDIRASAQGLLILICGCGLLLGNLLVGWVRDATGDDFARAYHIAAGISTVTIILFGAGFTTAISDKESLVPDAEIP